MICPKCKKGDMRIGIGWNRRGVPQLRYAHSIEGIDKKRAWYECKYCSFREKYPIKPGDKFIFYFYKWVYRFI